MAVESLFWGTLGKRLRVNQGCRRPEYGFILTAGSHSRHFLTKSMKSASSQFLRAVDQSFDAGGPRILPRFDRPAFNTTVPSPSVTVWQYLGYPLELMKLRALFDWSSSFWGGIPSNSIIHASWSNSSSPVFTEKSGEERERCNQLAKSEWVSDELNASCNGMSTTAKQVTDEWNVDWLTRETQVKRGGLWLVAGGWLPGCSYLAAMGIQ